MKEYEIEIEGVACQTSVIVKQIRQAFYDYYDVIVNIPIEEHANLTRIYQPDGSKVTKKLKTFLLDAGVSKEDVERNWQEFCKYIISKYTPPFKAQFFWGDKNKLGEGVYENGHTCFRKGGENQQSKDFLVKYRRVKMLVLQDKRDRERQARCIVFFRGGREIIFTNFYYHSFPQNNQIFVKSLAKMLGMKDSSFTTLPKDALIKELPIYLNGDSVLLRDNRSKINILKNKRLMPCPEPDCDKLTKEKDYFSEMHGILRVMGCCRDHAYALQKRKGRRICAHCNGIVTNSHYSIGDVAYCERCIVVIGRQCQRCERFHLKSNTKRTSDGYNLCQYCYESHALPCPHCQGKYFKQRNPTKDGVRLCGACFETKTKSCDRCGAIFYKQEKLTLSEKYGNVCSPCIVYEKEREEKMEALRKLPIPKDIQYFIKLCAA